MEVHPETVVDDFWNRNPDLGPRQEAVTNHFSRNRWQQTDRFLHIAKPVDPEATLRPTSFENVEPLNDHLRLAFKKFWATGTHIAVDETQESRVVLVRSRVGGGRKGGLDQAF